jgi:hypothetical protein
MQRPTHPRDRSDDVPDLNRVGAHRAENPRLHAGVVFLWALVATVALAAGGIAVALLLVA